jgi:hypothetical protein
MADSRKLIAEYKAKGQLVCEKCFAFFRKQHRYDAHMLTCKGKVCSVCNEVGHLKCGIPAYRANILMGGKI